MRSVVVVAVTLAVDGCPWHNRLCMTKPPTASEGGLAVDGDLWHNRLG